MPDPRTLCFVLMPFKDEMKDVYWAAIKPACEKAGFTSLRVDELKGTFNINRKIIEHIFSSAAIIADLTDWNPNVFYEMGVAHAIDNKTITIIQNKDQLPFDVAPYRGIFYEQTETGLVKLREDLVESLQTIADWCQHPSNPVQDFKPRDTSALQSDFERLQKTLRERDEALRAAGAESAAVQKQLRENLEQAIKKAAALQKELAQKQMENLALQKEIQISRQPAAPKSVPLPPERFLRVQPLNTLSDDAVVKMLNKKDFFDKRKNKSGKGLLHKYEAIEQHGQKLVRDHTTDLTWQQSGSPKSMNYTAAERYVLDLKAKKFAGYDDWRMPTIEEAMSLMECEEKIGDLYIDPVFDRTQRWIWTPDKADSADVAWVVDFNLGGCIRPHFTADYFVRVVR